MNAKDWYDVDDVLFFGSKEDILNLCCPDCGGEIEYSGSEEYSAIGIKCSSCGYGSRAHKIPENISCFKYFGENYRIPLREQKAVEVSKGAKNAII